MDNDRACENNHTGDNRNYCVLEHTTNDAWEG
jgi:hypothetical protein